MTTPNTYTPDEAYQQGLLRGIALAPLYTDYVRELIQQHAPDAELDNALIAEAVSTHIVEYELLGGINVMSAARSAMLDLFERYGISEHYFTFACAMRGACHPDDTSNYYSAIDPRGSYHYAQDREAVLDRKAYAYGYRAGYCNALVRFANRATPYEDEVTADELTELLKQD